MTWNLIIAERGALNYIQKRIVELEKLNKLNNAEKMELFELKIKLKELSK